MNRILMGVAMGCVVPLGLYFMRKPLSKKLPYRVIKRLTTEQLQLQHRLMVVSTSSAPSTVDLDQDHKDVPVVTLDVAGLDGLGHLEIKTLVFGAEVAARAAMSLLGSAEEVAVELAKKVSPEVLMKDEDHLKQALAELSKKLEGTDDQKAASVGQYL